MVLSVLPTLIAFRLPRLMLYFQRVCQKNNYMFLFDNLKLYSATIKFVLELYNSIKIYVNYM